MGIVQLPALCRPRLDVQDRDRVVATQIPAKPSPLQPSAYHAARLAGWHWLAALFFRGSQLLFPWYPPSTHVRPAASSPPAQLPETKTQCEPWHLCSIRSVSICSRVYLRRLCMSALPGCYAPVMTNRMEGATSQARASRFRAPPGASSSRRHAWARRRRRAGCELESTCHALA